MVEGEGDTFWSNHKRATSVINQKSSNHPLTKAAFGIIENKGKMTLTQFMYTESHEGDIAQ
jgi:hypothetical protein